MPIKKTIISPTHGVPVSAHKVSSVQHDINGKTTVIYVSSYFDENALQSGKQPIGSTSLFVQDEPAEGESNVAFAERVLVEARPASAPSAVQAAAMGVDRYMFEGGQLID